jgi:acetylornithine deacetylase
MPADVAGLLARLVAHRTDATGGDEVALARVLEEELAARGPDSVELIEIPFGQRTLAAVAARWGTPRLLVNAHLDTVPPNAGWSGDPFVARVVPGTADYKLIALGSADTKGAIAAILCALDAQKPRDTMVLFSGDEELSNECMRVLIERGLVRGIERAIVCEPTSLRLGTRHRGILSLEVTIAGAGGHSSFADTQPRPIAMLARVAVALDDWGQRMRTVGPDGFRGMCVNVAMLEGGVAFNVIPAKATLTISFRQPPGVDIASLQREIEALVHASAPEATTTWLMANPSFGTRSLASFTSLGEREVIDLAFWTEAALLSQAGIDAVVIGPGDIAHAHSPDEHVPLADLRAAQEMFTQVFAETHGSR